jgi:SEC-C motif
MAKVGRNEPCPCNSGKKFKKCHGLLPPGNLNVEHLGIISTKAKAAEFKLPGVPGMNMDLVLQAGYSDRESLKNVSNLPGKYKVLFTLNRPGYPLRSERMISSSEQLEGDSHLAIADPAVKYVDGRRYEFDKLMFEATTDNGHFVFHGKANKKGMLGTVETEPFEAQHFGDAALRALHAVAPTLSSISTALDVPVSIYQMEVIELRTNTRRISLKTPFSDVFGWIPALESVTPEQQKYISLYREALNSNSDNYSYLCFYRIIEGLRNRREQLRRKAVSEALASGEKPIAKPDERIPSGKQEQIEWLNGLYSSPRDWDSFALSVVFIPDVVGKRIRHLIDKGEHLHKLRNKIAHAVVDSGEPIISIDVGPDIEEVAKWLPITKLIARYLLLESFPDILKST